MDGSLSLVDSLNDLELNDLDNDLELVDLEQDDFNVLIYSLYFCLLILTSYGPGAYMRKYSHQYL